MSKYVVVTWPFSQDLMDKEGFEENSYLVNDEKGMKDFDGSAYFVDEEWLNKTEHTPSDEEKEELCDKVYAWVEDHEKHLYEHELDTPVYLENGDAAIGFFLDLENQDIKVIVDDSYDVDFTSFKLMKLDDRYAIAKAINNNEYTDVEKVKSYGKE